MGLRGLGLSSFFRISSLCKVGLSAHEVCIESSCKGHHDNCPDKYLIYIHRTHGMRIFFFRGQSDWFSMRSVFSYLFPQATVALSWVAEYIPTFSLPFFTNISRFSGWAVILSKDVDHYLKPINNLFILSFLSFKLILLTEKYWFQNEFV